MVHFSFLEANVSVFGKINVFFNPAAQFPDTVPDIPAHSSVVKQVPLRLTPLLERKHKVFKGLFFKQCTHILK